jgi:6-phospho-3-hexuloisomerase
MVDNCYEQIIVELKDTLLEVDRGSIDQLAEAIIEARHIFLAGVGRSGLMLKCFAMRLMHLGLNVFVVGETTTPAILCDDLLIIGSGSGETGSVTVFAQEAKRYGAKIGLITIFPDSTIGRLADVKVVINAPTSKNPSGNQATSIQPMGNLFEQSLLLLLDGLALKLMDKMNVTAASMFENHANLE